LPPGGVPLTATCPTKEATISITQTDGTPTGDVNEPITYLAVEDVAWCGAASLATRATRIASDRGCTT
jgi:hypothetical protein